MCEVLTHFDRRPDRQEQITWYNNARSVLSEWKSRRAKLRHQFKCLGGSDSRFNKMLFHTRTISDSVFDIYKPYPGEFILEVSFWPTYISLDMAVIMTEIKRLEKSREM